MIAAPQETRTPIFPRPARCGLLLFAPNPHTIADTMSANTLRMRPTVMTAPTMVRNWLMPGSQELLGSISICIGNNAERTGVASATAVTVFTIQAPTTRGRTELLPARVPPGDLQDANRVVSYARDSGLRHQRSEQRLGGPCGADQTRDPTRTCPLV